MAVTDKLLIFIQIIVLCLHYQPQTNKVLALSVVVVVAWVQQTFQI